MGSADGRSVTERCLMVVALLLLTEGPLFLILTGGASQGDGRPLPESYPLIQASFLLVYAASGIVLVWSWREVVALLFREKLILLLLLVVAASVLWSEAPALTARRIVAFTGTTLVGVHLAVRYRTSRQLQLLAWSFGIAIVLSLAMIVLFVRPNEVVRQAQLATRSLQGVSASSLAQAPITVTR